MSDYQNDDIWWHHCSCRWPFFLTSASQTGMNQTTVLRLLEFYPRIPRQIHLLASGCVTTENVWHPRLKCWHILPLCYLWMEWNSEYGESIGRPPPPHTHTRTPQREALMVCILFMSLHHLLHQTVPDQTWSSRVTFFFVVLTCTVNGVIYDWIERAGSATLRHRGTQACKRAEPAREPLY